MLPAWMRRARPRLHCRHHGSTVHSPQPRWPQSCPSRFSTTAPSHSTKPPPERILIIGSGISGLSLAHYLQHLTPSPHSPPRPHLRIVDASPSIGGWVDTRLPTADCPYQFERGPRSLLTRRGDSTLELVGRLGLEGDVVLADEAAKRRYVWDSEARKLVLLPTGINSSLFRFPFLGAVARGAWHELRTPARIKDAEAEFDDESIEDFITRRFNRTVAQELIDPLVAGIYSGNIRHLSLRSCFPGLHLAEQQSGSILRHMITAPTPAKQWMEGEEEAQKQPWVQAVRRNGTYSFRGGMRMLTDRLAEGVEARARAEGQGEVVRLGAKVERLVLGEEGVTAWIDGVEEQYDRVISTVSSKALARILANSTLSSQSSGTDSQHTTLEQPASATSNDTPALRFVDTNPSLSTQALLSSLSTSLSSLPYANVQVVNLAYPPNALRTPAFGLLCASAHSTNALLGIAFDSCTFPHQNSPAPTPIPTTTTTTIASATNATRLTAMIGGARFPHAASFTAAQAQVAAVASVTSLLGLQGRPLWVGGGLAEECIPQYVVGHGRWVEGVEAGVEAVNARLSGGVGGGGVGGGGKRRLDVLGAAYDGVSVNDLITRAKLFATQYYRKPARLPPDIATTGSEAGILPVAATA